MRPIAHFFLVTAFFLSLGPQSTASDLRFEHGDSTTPINMELASNKVHFRARLAGEELWMLIDTGANMSILNLDWTRAHGSELTGESWGDQAAGGRKFRYAFTEAPSLEIAGLTIEPRKMAVIDRHTEGANGHRSDGLFGSDLFHSLVVEIDYAARKIRFYDPEAFSYRGGGETLPIHINANGKPEIDVVLVTPDGDSHKARVLVDTGLRGYLALTRPFIDREKLEAALPGAYVATVGVGIGGPVRHRVARLRHIALGDLAIEGLPVDLPLPDVKGAFARDDHAGVLGAEVLRRFRVTFDFHRRQLHLEPAEGWNQRPEWDASGLFLVASTPDFRKIEVLDVVADSPAARVGLVAGDELLSLDAQAVEELGLDSVRARLRKSGSKVSLEVAGQKDARSVQIELEDLLSPAE